MSESNIPLPSQGASGIQPDGTATATCYCGAVQLSFPVEGEDFVTSFVCNCTDCRKITASMFASNFTVNDRSLKHLRGEDKLTRWAQSKTIASGSVMENSFCSVCGTLLYRRGSRFPGKSILRIGTVDDFNLHETKLRPRVEQFINSRVSWFKGVQGVEGLEQAMEAGF
ncbi:hypothetical protein NA57DRAFT_32030 [Rhizodiscina lignyota]|uniref:CENP-V/GFA domain-containing protein n=1 Tax=Rhizodiscina lignyota TaxID=1504668 RepID=A0A9P4IJU7_9PEZI|nr:hypothetical protein NA57DRAFT_32030 [Rhizodiscina lignyota]